MKRLALTLAVLALLAGCGKDKAQTDGAQPARSDVDTRAPKVYAFPDEFHNVATKCDDWGHRIYQTSHGNSAPVVITDPSCGKAATSQRR